MWSVEHSGMASLRSVTGIGAIARAIVRRRRSPRRPRSGQEFRSPGASLLPASTTVVALRKRLRCSRKRAAADLLALDASGSLSFLPRGRPKRGPCGATSGGVSCGATAGGAGGRCAASRRFFFSRSSAAVDRFCFALSRSLSFEPTGRPPLFRGSWFRSKSLGMPGLKAETPPGMCSRHRHSWPAARHGLDRVSTYESGRSCLSENR